jgi:hypothetical protein
LNKDKSCKINFDKNKGELFLKDFQISERVSFLDYIFGGCEIGLHIAIDFTASNGPPSHRNSLHYLNPNDQTN